MGRRSYKGNGNPNFKHGASKHPLFDVWKSMVYRCHSGHPSHESRWWGRGITVCDEWRFDVWSFINWGEQNGWQLGLEIDRINNDGHYTPDNCRFVTNREQANNRRPAVLTERGKEAIRNAVIASNKRRALVNRSVS